MDEANSPNDNINSNRRPRAQSFNHTVVSPTNRSDRSGSIKSSLRSPNSSPYAKLSSSKNLMNSTLPAFLQGKTAPRMDLSATLTSVSLLRCMSTEPADITHIRKNPGFQVVAANSLKDTNSVCSSPAKLSEIENLIPATLINLNIPQSSSSINQQPAAQKRRIISPEDHKRPENVSSKEYILASQPGSFLNVKKIQISNEELVAIKSKQPIPNKIIDACMTIFKHHNHYKLKTNQIREKVLISNTEFSNRIFSKTHNRMYHAKNNPFNYDILLFPIPADNNWTLLSLNLKEFRVEYFDPLQCYKRSSEIQALVYRFLKHELKHHQNKNIEDSAWRDLIYTNSNENIRLLEKDSSIYVLMKAYNISLGIKETFSHFNVSDHRRFLYDLLLEYGKL
ncbi:unnamed protein product [Blepharisma stoltei]|uniref:Ubiquitin-like protease family profile domain-containing protein n=1 Tax=Blepharisma stoltei TaxID=1481888 RepID=A0AAU9I6T2_9CILI|nr:unnamed protein product [Blepharisma stoltei]